MSHRLRATLVAGLALVAVTQAPIPGALATGDPARITSLQRTAPRVVLLKISTPAFATPTYVDVDLPTGYDSQPHRRWPVAYFLAGTMNTYASFNSVVHGVKLTASFPAIVVSPNGDSGYWSDWYNGGAFGPPMYETYVIDQLLPLIDATFRTIPQRSARAIAGVSMGGYGATMLAAEHPDRFADVASLSGADDSNLAPLGAALSVSPEFQGGAVDAIYGPRATEEVRWRGHNPTDLAANLRGLDIQLRTANGIPAPGIGENPASADSVSCVIEGGVHAGSVDLDAALSAANVPHLWRDYGPGCHTPANFTREITDTLAGFTRDFARPAPAPPTFAYESIAPAFGVWGWQIAADAHRALEFLRLSHAGRAGLTLVGSGRTTVTTPAWFAGLRRVGLTGATAATAIPDRSGRISFTVDLGAPDTEQQFTPNATTVERSRTVALAPYAVIVVGRIRASASRLRACVRALGGPLTARLSLVGPHRRALARAVRLRLGAARRCVRLPYPGRRTPVDATLHIIGRDRFGHAVSARRSLRIPPQRRR